MQAKGKEEIQREREEQMEQSQRRNGIGWNIRTREEFRPRKEDQHLFLGDKREKKIMSEEMRTFSSGDSQSGEWPSTGGKLKAD